MPAPPAAACITPATVAPLHARWLAEPRRGGYWQLLPVTHAMLVQWPL